MTLIQGLSLVFLALCLVLSIWRHVNIGLLALGFAMVLILVSGGNQADMVKTMLTQFPASLCLLLIGVTLLFAHLERSGAIQWFVDKIFALVGDRVTLLPWAAFVVGAFLSTCGAFSAAPIALLVPVMAHMAAKFKGTYWITSMATILGAGAGGFSPLNPTGQTVSTIAKKSGSTYSQWGLWAACLIVAAIVFAIVQIIDRLRARRGLNVTVDPVALDSGHDVVAPSRVYMISSGVALAAFVVMTVILRWDVGLSALLLAAILSVVFRPKESDLFSRVPWNGVLLLGGLLTYLGLMQQVGTMKQIERVVTSVHGAALIFVIIYLTAVLDNIESSTLGVMAITAPIVFSAYSGTPMLFWALVALCASGQQMAANPIHVSGTLTIANAAEHERDRIFNKLLLFCVVCTAIIPGVLSLLALAMKHV